MDFHSGKFQLRRDVPQKSRTLCAGFNQMAFREAANDMERNRRGSVARPDIEQHSRRSNVPTNPYGLNDQPADQLGSRQARQIDLPVPARQFLAISAQALSAAFCAEFKSI
jgi:hypothetical protein